MARTHGFLKAPQPKKNQNLADEKEVSPVFRSISQQQGLKLLKENDSATWLVRESSTAGLITIDYKGTTDAMIFSSSVRFVLVKEQWQIVPALDIATAKMKEFNDIPITPVFQKDMSLRRFARLV